MKIGRKSVLYGAHCFLIHPWFVALAWWKLYGFPRDYRLWCAFVLHDLGYWFHDSPNMDGPEGEAHPVWAAAIMAQRFDTDQGSLPFVVVDYKERYVQLGSWGRFVLLHSRYFSKRLDLPFSRLCVADKLAFCLTPRWLYLPMVRATGEIREYMHLADARTAAGEAKFAAQGFHNDDEELWFEQVKEYMYQWVEAHKTGDPDHWTPVIPGRTARTTTGVWQ